MAAQMGNHMITWLSTSESTLTDMVKIAYFFQLLLQTYPVLLLYQSNVIAKTVQPWLNKRLS